MSFYNKPNKYVSREVRKLKPAQNEVASTALNDIKISPIRVASTLEQLTIDLGGLCHQLLA